MQPKLLITNLPLEMMVKASNLPRLITYLNTTNDKNEFDNTIWFGIVPDVELNQTEGGRLQRVRLQATSGRRRAVIIPWRTWQR